MNVNPVLPTTLMALAMSACNATAMAADVPDAIAAPLGQSLLLEVHAAGSQIYQCGQGKGGPEWVFRSPEAILTDKGGQRLGKHYAGPTWESNDGSKVVGEVVASAPAGNAQSIPQLLLKAKSHAGSGQLEKVASIQRLDTEGGRAPATPCSADELGVEQKVPYSATYYFYGDNPRY